MPTEISPEELRQKLHDLIIIGSGPAAHTAAIYSARANLEPVVFEGFMAGGIAAGGQLTTTTEVENYPGFPEGIDGPKMMELFRAQSERFGARIITATVSTVDFSRRPFQIWLEGEDRESTTAIRARSIIVATGATAKRLHLPGEEQYWQKGISACAVCDGALPIFRNKPLAVIGGGDSAAEEALFLTKYGSRVYVIHRRDKLRASHIMQQRLFQHPKCEIIWDHEVTEAFGDEKQLTGIKIKNRQNEKIGHKTVSGLFYAIGHIPNTKPFQGQLSTDKEGYIKVKPGSIQTDVEGVFAAGDVQDKRYRQAVTAAGSGCMAALDAERWLNSSSSNGE